MMSVNDRISRKCLSQMAECVPDDQLQDTKSQALANSYNISHIICTLPGDENKRKNRALQWKQSIHIRTRVAVSEVLIRLRNLLLPRHQFTQIEQKPASVCQRMTKLATECACMEFHLTGRDQLCSEWRSWWKCVIWMGWQQPSSGVHQVLRALIILCCLVSAKRWHWHNSYCSRQEGNEIPRLLGSKIT